MFKRLILTTALLFMFVSTVSAWTVPQMRPYPDHWTVVNGSAALPAIAFGDGDTGFYEVSDDTLRFAAAGTEEWSFTTDALASVTASGAFLDGSASTSTNPAFTFASDTDTGVGRQGADTLSLIAGGVEGIRVTADPFVGVGVAPLGILHTAPSGALTTTAEEGFRIQAITSGTAGVGFGSFIRMQGEDAGAANRDMVLLQAEWNDATDSAADADFVVKVATNSAATTEKFRVKNTGSVRFVPTTVGALIACAAGLAGDNVYITFENSMCFCNGTNYVRYDDGTTCTDS